jgi:hypothetical protein
LEIKSENGAEEKEGKGDRHLFLVTNATWERGRQIYGVRIESDPP